MRYLSLNGDKTSAETSIQVPEVFVNINYMKNKMNYTDNIQIMNYLYCFY